jgi:prefoldin subunit 5
MIYSNSALLQKTIFITSLVLSIIFVGSYIAQVQRITQGCYQTKIYQREIKDLATSVQALDNQYQSANSLEQLIPKIETLGLVKIETLAYLDLGTNQMAVK